VRILELNLTYNPLPTSPKFPIVANNPYIRMLARSLLSLLLIPFTARSASGATPRATKCKVVKRQQGLFHISPTDTSPAANPPTAATTSYATSTTTSSPTPTVLPPFDYGKGKVRGVNLGGWFMMEVSARFLVAIPWRRSGPRTGSHRAVAGPIFIVTDEVL
jgi:hypothetical protein